MVVTPADEEPAKEETSGEAPVTAQEEAKEPPAPEEIDPEKELEAWHEFAADHYEMVEQLPLELHRNFRLLRELDDGCTSKLHDLGLLQTSVTDLVFSVQADKLQALIREYIGLRLPKRDQDADQDTTTLEIQSEAKEETIPNMPEESARQTPPRPSVEGVPDIISENGPAAEALGVPLPDGQGGLLLPARIGLVEDDGPTFNRNHFPSTPGKSTPGGIEGDSTGQNGAVDANVSPSGQRKVPGQGDNAGPSKPSRARGKQSSSSSRPSDLLPSIGRLVKDLVRNGEEKVAVAIGAYNAVGRCHGGLECSADYHYQIDRHIRALDSALSTQEASILLGLRVDTNPSTAVDESLNLPTDENAVPVEEEGDVIIGLGGGGARRKKGRGRGRKNNKKEPEPVLSAAEANGWIVIPSDVDIDP